MKFVFLLYFSRSGSTMLANMIAKRMCDVIVFPEVDFVGFLFAEGNDRIRKKSAPGLLRLLKADDKLNDLGLAEADWSNLVENCERKDINHVLTEIAILYAQKQGKPYPKVALFQRGTLLSHVKQISKTIPTAKYIYIYRDPRASINSIIGIRSKQFDNYDARKMGRKDVLGLSRNWLKYYKRVRNLEETDSNSVSMIRYENVCKEPCKYLRQLSGVIGAEIAEEKESSLLNVAETERELHPHINSSPILERLYAWREELSPWRGYIVEKVIGDELSNLGYTLLYFGGVTSIRGAAYQIFAFIESVYEWMAQIGYRLECHLRNPICFSISMKMKFNSLLNRIGGSRHGYD